MTVLGWILFTAGQLVLVVAFTVIGRLIERNSSSGQLAHHLRHMVFAGWRAAGPGNSVYIEIHHTPDGQIKVIGHKQRPTDTEEI